MSKTLRFHFSALTLVVFALGLPLTARAQFAPPQVLDASGAPSTTPFGAATGDLNRDGRPDIVMPSSQGILVYYSNASGYGYPTTVSTPCASFGTQAAAVGDMDGDGWLDVVATCRYANSAGTEGALVVLWGASGGQFPTVTSTPTFISSNVPLRIVLGDFGLGRLDVALARSDEGSDAGVRVASFRNNLDRTFSQYWDLNLWALGSLIVRNLVSADFNGDGYSDIAVASDTRVVVFNRQGTQVIATIPYPHGPNNTNANWSIGAGDFDRDGRTDLVVGSGNGRLDFWRNANATTGSQAYWTGAAWQTYAGLETLNFTAAGSISTQQVAGNFDRTPMHIAVADLNRDGWLDVASANTYPAMPYGGTYPGSVTVALGGASGFTEMAGSPIAVGNIAPNAIVASDLNGDGLLDLLVPDSSGANKPVVLTNTFPVLFTAPSSLTFWASAPPSGTISPAGISMTVKSSTGAPSIGATASQPWIGALETLGGTGATTPFTVSVDASTRGPGTSRGIATFSSSGYSRTTANVTLKAARPAGTLSRSAVFTPTDRRYDAIAIGDVNGDGQLDFIVDGHTLISNGAGAFTDVVNNVYSFRFTQASVTADFNRDGKLDFAFSDGSALVAALGNGNGSFQNPNNSYPPTPSGNYTFMTSLASGDFDADGNVDLLAVDTGTTKRLLLFRGTPAGRFGIPETIAVPSCPSCWPFGPSRVTTGDFNADGRLDLMAAGDGDFAIMLGNASGTGFTLTPDSLNTNVSYAGNYNNGSVAAMTVADMNRDGIDDVLLGYQGNIAPRAVVRVLFGNPTIGAPGGGFTVGPKVPLAQAEFGVGQQQLVVADVNGDGNPDVAEIHAQSTTFAVALGDGLGGFTGVITYDTQHPYAGPYGGSDYIGLGAGDVNGDGRTDLLVLQAAQSCSPSCATSWVYAFTGTLAATSTTIHGGGTAQYGQNAPVTVTVSAQGGISPPTGNVSLKENGAVIASSQRSTPGVWTFTGIPVGPHTVTAQYDGDLSNALSSSTTPVSFTITKATGSVSVTSNLSPVEQGDPVTLTASLSPVSAGGVMTFKDGATTIGTETVNAFGQASIVTTSLAPGTRSITAAFGGDGNVNATSSVWQQVVNPGANSITLTGLATTYDGAPKRPTAITIPANLQVDMTFAAGTCPSVSGVSATAPTAAGSYCVTATINDPSSPTLHNSTSDTLVIAKAVATITVNGVSQFFDGNPKPVTVTTNPANLAYALTYAEGAIVPSAVGTYPVQVTVSDANYSGSASATLEISTKPASAITVSVPGGAVPTTYGTPVMFWAVVNAARMPANGTVTILVDGVQAAQGPLTSYPANGFSGLQAMLTNAAGSHTITATYSGDAQNASSQSAPITQLVNKATAAIGLSNLSQTYAGAGRSVTTTTAPAGLQVVVTYNASPALPVTVGDYAVVATINDANYLGSATGTLSISRAVGTAAYSGLVSAYDGQPHAIGVVTTPAVAVAVTYQQVISGVLQGTASATAPVNAGNYRVTISAANYSFPAPPTDMTITKRGVTITLGNLSQVADGSPKSVSVTTNPAGINVVVKYTDGFMTPTTTPPTVAPGPFAQWHWTAQASINDPNYAGSASTKFDLREKRPTTTVLAGPATGKYGQTLVYTAEVTAYGYAPTGTVTFRNGDTVIGTVPLNIAGRASAFASFVPGTHNVMATYTGDAAALASSSGSVNTVITKAILPITVTGANTFIYDRLAKSLKFTTPIAKPLVVTYDGSACTGTPSAAALAPPVNARATPYVVKACVANDPYYEGSAVASLTINKAAAAITLGSLRHAFDSAPKQATATTNPPGVAVMLTYAGSASAPTAVGSYPVAATSGDPNYTGSATGTLTIDTAAALITIGNTVQDYDGTGKAVSVAVSPSLTYSVTYGGSSNPPSEAGIYPVTVSVTQAGYTGTATGTLTIRGRVRLAVAPGADGALILDGAFVNPGTVYLSPGTHTIHVPDTDAGFGDIWRFYSWGGDTTNPRTFTVGSNGNSWHSFTAYTDRMRVYTPQVNPSGAGRVTGGGYYRANQTMTFAATPSPGFVLDRWTYGGTTSTSPTFLAAALNSSEMPVAHFVPAYVVTPAGSPALGAAGGVRVANAPGTPYKPTATIKVGTQFDAYASHVPGYLFHHWSTSGVALQPNYLGVDPATYQSTPTFTATSTQVSVVANYVKDEPNLTLSAGARQDACFELKGVGPCVYREQSMNFTNTGYGAARNVAFTGFKVARARVDLSAFRATLAKVSLLGWTYPLSPTCYVDFETGADPCDLRTLRFKLLAAAPLAGPLGVYLFDTALAIEIALVNPPPTLATSVPVTIDRAIAPGVTDGVIFGFNWRTIKAPFSEIAFDYEVRFTYQASGVEKTASLWMR